MLSSNPPSALHSVDPEAFTALMAQASDGVKRDLGAYNAYWQQFEGRVQEISSSVNNAYLQSNLQEDGVKSYGRVVDLNHRLLYVLKQGEGVTVAKNSLKRT